MSLLFTTLLLSKLAMANVPLQLFYIQRNKNSNEVHYEIQTERNCRLKKDEPVRGYWRELEKGPDVTSPIGTFEQVAYGVIDQSVQDDSVNFKMKAIPDKEFKAKLIKGDDKCVAEAYTLINKQEAVLKKIYIFAVEGLIRPKVKYIDLYGNLPDGKEIKERMEF